MEGKEEKTLGWNVHLAEKVKYRKYKLSFTSFCLLMKKVDIKKDKEKPNQPSAVEDCADVTSRYKRYEKKHQNSQFPPVEYEKPPHH